eukprot:Partr_v1_DN22791_c0_g1_i1_m37923 putative Component of the U1 snRNP, which is essential for recognition of the pre-mRNA 5' splice-site and the subsequent assembly of the spliceosome. U1-C is directly involved in initial 5' splice-site recognition for both constitutive and regulated alternative splicing. The interaction with the 5' splice-site seems to precede base-pairing between the pre-mRNA and the U1 snRNA
MPKYYCDYCDIYLTHDSLAVRRAHNDGWKHQGQVKEYYAGITKEYTQFAIGQITRPGFPPPFRPPPMGMPPMGPGMPPPHLMRPPFPPAGGVGQFPPFPGVGVGGGPPPSFPGGGPPFPGGPGGFPVPPPQFQHGPGY